MRLGVFLSFGVWFLLTGGFSQHTDKQGTCSARGACRMGIDLTNVSSVALYNLKIQSTGGDGLFARGVTDGVFSKLVLDDNFRQGCSISSGRNLLFEDSVFSNTGVGQAASPACGVDMEPDHGNDALTNITFRRCVAANNTGCGFSISPHNLLSPPFNGRSREISVRFEDSSVDNRGQLTQEQCRLQPGGCGWTQRAGWVLSGFPPSITGSVNISGGTSVGGEGPMVTFQAYGGGCKATLSNLSLSNAGIGVGDPPAPVVLLAPTSTGKYEKTYGSYRYGGVAFFNVSVALQAEAPAYEKQGHHRAWLEVDSPHGLSDLSLNASMRALPGSGGCALVKEKLAQATKPWNNVTLSHSCTNAPA